MLIELLIFVLVLGLVVWIARQVLPQPWQNIAIAVCVVFLLVWLLRFAGVILRPASLN